MSYMQIEIGGVKYGLKFNQLTLVEFQEKVDYDNLNGTTAYALIWAALRSNAFVKREEFTISFEDVCDLVDKIPADTMIEIVNKFKDTQLYKDLLPEDEAADDKKKLVEENTDPIA